MQSMSACVITNMLHFQHSPNLKENVQLAYIVTDVDYDSGKLFSRFYNVCQRFCDDSYSVRFDCGIILPLIKRSYLYCYSR